MNSKAFIETTLGDLIVALTDEAAPYVENEKEAYAVAAIALVNLLSDSDRGAESFRSCQ